jgi:hypothetical protein
MSEPNGRLPAPRKQTPRVPMNTLYTRVVPVAIGLMAVVLLIVLVYVLASALGVRIGY